MTGARSHADRWKKEVTRLTAPFPNRFSNTPEKIEYTGIITLHSIKLAGLCNADEVCYLRGGKTDIFTLFQWISFFK